MSSNLTWNMHVDNLTAKAGKMLYMLYQLKRAGLSKEDRTRIYLRVRPTREYACPVWHIGLPKYLSDGLEMIQKRALRSIYPGYHYEDILRVTGLQKLAQRRDQLCKEYLNKPKDSHRVDHLFAACKRHRLRIKESNEIPQNKGEDRQVRKDFYPMDFVQLPITFYQGCSKCNAYKGYAVHRRVFE